MKNKIRVKQDAATLDHYFDMEDFKSMFDDISEIAYYEINMDDLNADESNHVTG